MSYALGLRAIKRLCIEQHPMAWQKAKLSDALFKAMEVPVFEWVQQHVKKHHALPHLDTLHAHFPELQALDVPEPSSYYVQLLENRYFYDRINKANVESQAVLKDHADAHEKALEMMRQCIREITAQKYRLRILDVVKEAPSILIQQYYTANTQENTAVFGWPYMDAQSGGMYPGDVISLVGRPALGKTWLTLWMAIQNWVGRKVNVLFVSMEMMTLPIAQRIGAIYTHQNIKQLKTGGFSSTTFQKFYTSLQQMTLEEAKFFVIDGNLAASVEDVFALADMLECRMVVIDGAYLLRHKNVRLDRYMRAAENVELIKRFSTDLDMITVASWQFNREASKKQKKTGETGDLEDIGYSDAIGQISSIALSLYQEDSVETMKNRKIRVMKGRNGEIGQYTIAWDFDVMDFSQVDPVVDQADKQENKELQWV